MQRIHKEISLLQQEQPDGVHVFIPSESADMRQLSAQIIGPPDTPYAEGIYTLTIRIPERYPFEPPKAIKYETRIYHPNIDSNGRICLDILKMPPNGNWKPSLNISSVLLSLRLLMSAPNPDDPLDADIASQYIKNRLEFTSIAAEWNRKYASGGTVKEEVVVKDDPVKKDPVKVEKKREEEVKDDVQVKKRMRLNLSTRNKR